MGAQYHSRRHPRCQRQPLERRAQVLPLGDPARGVDAYADHVEAKRAVPRDRPVVVMQPGERQRAQLALLGVAHRDRRTLRPAHRGRAERLDLDEDERRSVERDQVDLAAHGGGPLVAGDDPHPPALERIGDQRLGGASQSLAGLRHRRRP